ncbi:MAG: hypothetical protein ACYSWS_03015 [Planctomycetota bacterium]
MIKTKREGSHAPAKLHVGQEGAKDAEKNRNNLIAEECRDGRRKRRIKNIECRTPSKAVNFSLLYDPFLCLFRDKIIYLFSLRILS